MRKIYLSIIFFVIIVCNLNGQDINYIKSQNTLYVWGEGVGKTLKQADREALSMLIDQIQTQVKSNFEHQLTEQNGKIDEKVKSIIQTYSNATLKNTERLIVSNEPKAKVFRYIKREEIAKIFESRKNKIIEFTENAQYSTNKLQIADALRYYYWAYILLRSHPDYNSMRFLNTNSKSELLSVFLPLQIRNLLNSIKIQIVNSNKNEDYINYIISIKYNNQPVTNFTYSFWDGVNYSYLIAAKDGIGFVELPSNEVINELKIKTEYAFEGESTIDLELNDAMKAVEDEITFKEAYITISTKETKPVLSDTIPILKKAIDKSDKTTIIKELEVNDAYLAIMQKVEKAIQTKNYSVIENHFTLDGFEMFKKLIAYGRAKILINPTYHFIQYENNVICRSLKMSFYFPNNNQKFIEDVVFTFNSDKKIESLAFGLSQNTLHEILTPDKPWSDDLKIIIINFLENYKTAYALKRIDYIEKIFSDDAIIITGSIVKIKNTNEVKYKENNIVRYNTQTKEQYLKNLRFCFNSNEYINLRFNESNIRKSARGEEVYGIQLKQDYFSSNYGDTGYLFLLVDLKNPKEPIIHVRTWQPDKNPDGSIYGIQDF